jgi:hypothetical protein
VRLTPIIVSDAQQEAMSTHASEGSWFIALGDRIPATAEQEMVGISATIYWERHPLIRYFN